MNTDYDNKDWAMIVLPHLDYVSQLRAISNLLSVHKKAEQVASRDIDKVTGFLENYGNSPDEYFYHLRDERGERIQAYIYQDAAYSMAAIGMLAPLLESLFHQAFYGIQDNFYPNEDQSIKHKRFQESVNKTWDCHFVWSSRQKGWIGNLEEGIVQLSEATGLQEYLPTDFKKTLNALFSYRNKMFHCGFEWPLGEREQFYKRIKAGQLPGKWFNNVSSGGMAWIFYLSDEFITHCLDQTDSIIEGIGIYVKKKINTL